MNSNINRILDLIKKTGDKVIVASEFSDPYVLMNIEQYEQMVNNQTDYHAMSEQDILNKVNRDISLWKQAQREMGWNPEMEFVSNSDLQGRLPLDLESEREQDIVPFDDQVETRRGVSLPESFEPEPFPEPPIGWDSAADLVDRRIGIDEEDEYNWEEEEDEDEEGKDDEYGPVESPHDNGAGWDEDFDEDFGEDEEMEAEEIKKSRVLRRNKEIKQETRNPTKLRNGAGKKLPSLTKATADRETRDVNGANKNAEPIKYEDIPPPPPVTSVFEEEEKSVIDMSYSDESQMSSDSADEDEDFLVEPIE